MRPVILLFLTLFFVLAGWGLLKAKRRGGVKAILGRLAIPLIVAFSLAAGALLISFQSSVKVL